jgi:urease beta subunit
VTETDAAPPVLIDATEKAGERDLVLAFSEPVYANNNATGSLTLGDFTYTNSNPGGATAFSTITDADGSNNNIIIQMDALYVVGDGNTDRIAINNNEAYDAVGLVAVNCQTGTNCNGTYVTTRITSGDAPALQTAETMDIDGNGKIDHYKLTFDVPVNDSTFPGYLSANALGTVTTAWVIGTRTNLRIDTRDALPPTGPGDMGTNDNVIYLAFDENAAACSGNDFSGCDSGAIPNLSTTASPGLTDFDPTTVAQIVSFTATDKAPPKLITLKGHGNATSLVAYFSEAVFTNIGGSGNLTAADFTYQNDNVGGATAITGLTEANGADGKVTLTTTGSFVMGDDNADDLVAASNAVYDAGNNSLVATTPVRVVPLLLSAETMDIDANGVIDHYKLTFSMAVNDASFPGHAANALGSITTDWAIASSALVRIDTRTAAPPNGPGDTANDSVIYLSFISSQQTDATPDITTTTSPSLALAGGITMEQISSSSISELDKAAPVIIAATAPISANLEIRFSERIFTNPASGDTLTPGDFSYTDGNSTGAGSITGLSEASGVDGKVTLTLNVPFTAGDHHVDQIAAATSEVFDAAGNASTANRTIAGLPRAIANGNVFAMVEGGGIVYLGGEFTQVGPHTGNGVLLNDTDGQQVAFLTERVNGAIDAVIPDGNGGFFIGGSFTQIGSQTRNRIARINADGSLHAWNPDANSKVMALALSGSTVYVGGDFTTIGAQARNHIAALDMTTGNATAWNPNADNSVRALAVSGTRVFAGGSFNNIGGQTRLHIASLDTSTGNANIWNPIANNVVNALVVTAFKVYAGGEFTAIGGQFRNYIGELGVSSDSATAWNPDVNGTVNTIAVSGTTIYVGGSFTTFNGFARNRIAAVNENSNSPTAWNPNANSVVRSLIVSGANVLAGGDFTTIGGQARNRIAALDVSTGSATAWNPNASNSVNALAVSGTTIYAGGGFTAVGAQTRNRIAAIDTGTGNVTPWNPNASSTVMSLAVSGTTVYAGGGFMTVGGQTRNFIAALDVSTGSATAWNPNSGNIVYALAVSGTNVYAGGAFTTVGGQTRNRVAALDVSTGSATAWNPNSSNIVYALAVSGTNVYAGGDFITIGGQTRNRIAAIDVSTGNATAWNPDANNRINALAVSGTTVYAGGSFTTIGGQARNRIAAIDISTGSATTWNPDASGLVRALAVSGTTLYAGGDFTTIGGQARNYIAALDLSTGSATASNPNASASVYALAFGLSGKTLYAGGIFTTIASTGMSYFAGIEATTGQALEY